jgi:hypothetical protein
MYPPPPENLPDLVQLVAYFDNDDIFIKSIRYESPSSVVPGYIVAPNALGNLSMVFLGFDAINSLEISLTDVEGLAVAFTHEITFTARYDAFLREYTLTLNELYPEIRCKSLSYTVQFVQ